MRNTLYVLFICLLAVSCKQKTQNTADDKNKINTLLNDWHNAAAKADYNNYFKHFADNATFIGTDATEHWDKKSFMTWLKPFFDRGKAWSFTSLERHLFFDATGNTAWFDELLNTQMKICRGSGVVTKKDNEWKIEQYVLSMTIPNDLVDTIVPIKTPIEDSLINKLKKK